MLGAIMSGTPIVLALFVLESFLSVDNALVLAAIIAHLPTVARTRRPYQFRFGKRTLSWYEYNPRKLVLRVGLLLAYILRAALLLAASWLIANPWIKLIAAFYLIYLSCSKLGIVSSDEKKGGSAVASERGLIGTLAAVSLADLMFSIDNIMGAVAYSDKIWAVITGVMIGITAMRFVAGFFVKLVDKVPALANIAYVLVGSIGLQLLASDLLHADLNEFAKFGLVLVICGGGIIYERVPLVHRLLLPVFRYIGILMGLVDISVEQSFSRVVKPTRRLFAAAWRWIRL